jgi:hypothetical protein
MRGTIIAWSGDHGVVASAGKRYDFDINQWQGDVVPAANMTVELTSTDGKLIGIVPVSEAELATESLAAMTGKGSRHAKAIFDSVGRDVAIGYGVFFVLAMFVSVITTGGSIDAKVTLADLLSGEIAGAALGGGSGRGVLLVLLATTTVAAPHFWKHKLAPLAFFGPLLLTLKGFWPLYEQHRQQQQAIQAMGELGQALGQMAEQMEANAGGPLAGLGIGAWFLVATVIFLAFKGITHCLARGRRGVTSSSAS